MGDGTVETRANNTILFHGNQLLLDYLNIPIELIGTEQILHGNNSSFVLSMNANNSLLVLDQTNGNTSVNVDVIYGNKALKIETDYPNAPLFPSQYYIV